VIENRVLRRISGPKRDEVTGGWRKLSCGELHASYSSPDIIRQIKSRSMIGRACGTHGSGEKLVQGFGGESRRKKIWKAKAKVGEWD
jgi:hypothetical protein